MSQSELQQAKEEHASVVQETVYKGKIITVRKDIYSFKGEEPYRCDLVLHPGAVAILPIASDGSLLLIRQWRRAAGHILIEVPAGTLEKGEDAAECAARELREETGYKAADLSFVGSFFSAPGFCNELLHFFIARDLRASPLPPDAHEAIDLFPVTLNQALELIDHGKIIDAKTIIAILQFARKQG